MLNVCEEYKMNVLDRTSCGQLFKNAENIQNMEEEFSTASWGDVPKVRRHFPLVDLSPLGLDESCGKTLA